jgi:hypothetical protein
MNIPREAKGGSLKALCLSMLAIRSQSLLVEIMATMAAERRERTARPASLEAAPQTCGKMVRLLVTESWLLVEVEDMVNPGLVTSAVADLAVDMLQGIHSA